jgi:hypothetical protein
MGSVKRCAAVVGLLLTIVFGHASAAGAADRLCDPAHEDCRDILVRTIRNEFVGIDVAFWFMEDQWYANELIAKWRAGVRVRVLVDTRANASYPRNGPILDLLRAAGIPMRERFTGGILHWKMMLFSGQGIVQFSGANYSPDAWLPLALPLYSNYVDEAILFSDRASLVNSFRTKYDDLWLDTVYYRNFANVPATRIRVHDIFPKDAELNFAPAEPYANRAIPRYNAESQRIDVIMYRITDRRHADAMIAAVGRGVPVRLITEPRQYRDATRLWHSFNVDRMYMAGVQIKHRRHAGVNHQKTVLLHAQRMAINGSSNWTQSSDAEQEEHNLFTRDSTLYSWFVNQFERKWHNSTGVIENEPFVPLAPDQPRSPLPASGATGVPTTGMRLEWEGGPWAHIYDVYLGTSSNPSLWLANQSLGPSEYAGHRKGVTLTTTLQPGTTYYWRIVGKTMANRTASSPVWSFTTTGAVSPPPPPSTGSGDIVVYAADASARAGSFAAIADGSAAGGAAMATPDAGVPKLITPLASPAHYFEVQFSGQAGRGYRLWLRGRATNNYYGNDSVWVQFSGAVTASGSPTWQIGSASGTEVNLENCSGCGLSGWGWQDNGWGIGVLGPLVYFATTGTQRMRIQSREDGFVIDQIVLSPSTFLTSAPGSLKDDRTILARTSGGTTTPPPPTTSGEIVLRAGDFTVLAGGWRLESDPGAAGGTKARHPEAGAAKLASALTAPTHFVEVTFTASAGVPYRIWIRGRADADYWGNDSVFLQFDRTVDVSGNAIWRIGSADAGSFNLEDCSGCGLAGWGWQDNGWGVGVMGPLLRFSTTGTQRLRIQTREDGLSIDQIVISPSQFLNRAPGSLRNDATIVPR